ncbi:hypothetical protein D9M70_486010 [compost metagenome]
MYPCCLLLSEMTQRGASGVLKDANVGTVAGIGFCLTSRFAQAKITTGLGRALRIKQ